MPVREPAGGLFAEATVRTVSGLVAAESVCIDYLCGVNDAGRTCVDVWSAVQSASLGAAFGFLNAVFQLSPFPSDVPMWGRQPGRGERPYPGQLWPDATLEITATGVRLVPGVGGLGEPAASDSRQAEDWATSALDFPAPLGVVLAHWYDLLDE